MGMGGEGGEGEGTCGAVLIAMYLRIYWGH